jgi:hypothetical protein
MANFKPLSQIAKIIRSKNAGVDKITFDIIFPDQASYQLVRALIANLYNIPESRISDFVEFEPALAIKFTIYREKPSGSPGDTDIFGSQQYAPLLDLQIPVD